MKILILGGHGYLGWPTAMHLSNKGHEVMIIDNYLKRDIAKNTNSTPLFPIEDLDKRCNLFYELTGKNIYHAVGDCCDFQFFSNQFKNFMPDAVIHYAEQPSAPYSMIGYAESKLTLSNNLDSTFNLIWCVLNFKKDCHIVKLGTMGEYGTPDIDIEEGWINIEHNGRKDKFLFPRQAGSLYHTTKVLDTDLLWFYVRTYNLRVTDLMQGPVYGVITKESALEDGLLTSFYYDDIFGTVMNRFLVQAICNVPLTVYGQGGQTRGYLNIKDTLQCIELALTNPPTPGNMEILNQFTEQFTVLELAKQVQDAAKEIGITVEIKNIDNPRKEKENHYYNAKHSKFSELGLEPSLMNAPVLIEILQKISKYRKNIDVKKIFPRVKWR